MTTLTGMEHLSTIGLDELNHTAALLTRVDRKYMMTRSDAGMIGELLPAQTRILEIGGKRRFGYSSVYLDSPALDLFAQTAHRRRHRMKVRTRTYRNSGDSWLEVKIRHRGLTVKKRIPHTDGSERLSADGHRLINESARHSGLPGFLATVLRPVLDSHYYRTTLLLPDAVRLTMDLGLGWTSLFSGRRYDTENWLILETKGFNCPSEFDRQLWSLGHRPIRISKYATGLALLHPDLPRNRWIRALRQLL